ncbi:hypothetical protein [Cryptosporangium minutisporangium]|uniref:Secreted protein n=1 Tax=Cryptosporangium minutisporangium TaxID=113569 RepID=A0ABP6T2Q0_9ACTN
MRKTLTRIVATAALASAGLGVQVLATSPAQALAPPALERTVGESATSTLAAKTAKAICPPGTVVLGGGAEIVGPFAADPVKLVGSFPVQENGAFKWEVRAEAPAGFSGSWSVRSFAVCGPAPAGYRIFAEPDTAAASATFKTAATNCPGTDRAIGSGARVTTSGTSTGEIGLQLYRTSGPRDISRAAAREDATGFSGSWTLNSYAICTLPNAVPGAAPDGSLTQGILVSDDCPTGTFVHGPGGGAGLTENGLTWLRYLTVSPDLRTVEARMSAPSSNGTITSSVCAR